jgi:hypothetical protein
VCSAIVPVLWSGALKVKFNADYFSAYGADQIKPCLSNGFWSLYKGEKLVAYARASGSELYPGPGTYTLTASVEVKAVVRNAGFAANGKISHDITLTTPVPPGPRLNGGTNRADGTLTVTVTNVGNMPATNVKINIEASGEAADAMLEQRIAITDDSRCSDKRFGAECKLSSLAPEVSASFDLTSAAEDLCDRAETSAFAYSYTACGTWSRSSLPCAPGSTAAGARGTGRCGRSPLPGASQARRSDAGAGEAGRPGTGVRGRAWLNGSRCPRA